MSDIVDRLRELADLDARSGEPLGKCMREAADYIEQLTFKFETMAATPANLIFQNARLRKEVETLRKALEETAEVLNLMDSEGVRAAAFNNVPEDGLIRELCERIGYGAVMDSAARQWFKKDSVGAITTGTCAGTLRNLKALVRTALRDGGRSNDSP